MAPAGGGAREIRVALIGYGLGGRAFHAPMIASTPGLRLAAVVTSNPERGAQVSAEHPTARIVEKADDVFGNAADFDLAVVTTPNRTHVPLALAALDAGLPVVVDKPLAATSAEARRVMDAAQRRKLLLTVYHNRRFDGDYRTVTQLVRDGTLGDVHRFESRFERWRSEPRAGWREHDDPSEAGGLLFDLGSHLIDQALHLFGPTRDVYAELDHRRPSAKVDDDVFVALTHASGVRSHLWMSLVAADTGPRFRVLGSKGAYTKHGMDVQEEALRSGGRPGTPGWGVEPKDRWGVFANGVEATAVPTERGAYQDFYAGIVKSLATGASPPVDPLDAIAAIEVIEAARAFL